MEKDRRPRMDREEMRERTESSERRRAERRKEREERHKREKEKVRNGEKPKRKPQGLDIIDKLDVTGIYGQGCEWFQCANNIDEANRSSVSPRWTIRRL